MRHYRKGFTAAVGLMCTVLWVAAQAAGPPVVLDADPDPGYQGATVVAKTQPGMIVSVEIFGRNLEGAAGFSAAISFDPSQVSFAGFTASDLIPGLTGLVLQDEPGMVEVGGASVSGTAMHARGLLGVVRFEVVAGPAEVSVTKASLTGPEGQMDYDVASTVVIGGAPPSPVALDADMKPGYQGGVHIERVEPGQIISMALVGSELMGAMGFSATLSFDPKEMSFAGFSATELIPGFSGLTDMPEAGTVVVGGASVMGSAMHPEGLLGVVRFEVAAGFSGGTRISVAKVSLAMADGPMDYDVKSSVAVGEVSGPPSPDFDGDGEVGFTDFIEFAQVFGANKGDGRYNAKFDLDQDDNIGFTDFIQFAQAYGKPAPKPARASRPVGPMPGVNGNASLGLAPQEGEFYVMAMSLTDVVALQGYEMVLRYDAAALQFVEARRPFDGLLARAGHTPLFLAQQTGPGEVILADAIVDEGRASGSGTVAEVVFRQVAGAGGAVEVEAARLFDGAGGVDLIGASGRFAPSILALEQNFPNPFNPDTQIAYRIPEEAAVQLSVYDVTGQLVRRLVDGVQGPGHYRVVWDARDVAGREVASGIYLYRLETGSAQMARKMLLVR